MPFVPGAELVLVDDPSDDAEGFLVEHAFGADLDRRAVGRQIGDLADLLQVEITADEDRLAVLADCLHAARPAESDGRAALGTAGGPPAHACIPAAAARTYCRATDCTVTESASNSRRRFPSKSHSARGRQQKTFRQTDPYSGNVWQARCDSDSRQRPVMPAFAGNWCHCVSPTGRRRRSSMMRANSA